MSKDTKEVKEIESTSEKSNSNKKSTQKATSKKTTTKKVAEKKTTTKKVTTSEKSKQANTKDEKNRLELSEINNIDRNQVQPIINKVSPVNSKKDNEDPSNKFDWNQVENNDIYSSKERRIRKKL